MEPISLFVYALLQAVFALLALLLQGAALPILLLFRDYRTRITHQMMFLIGLLDLCQLVPLFLFIVFFLADISAPTWIEKICAGIYILSWDALIVEHFLLALNRALMIIQPLFRPTTKQSRVERRLFLALNSAVWLWLLCFLALFQTPLIGGKFYPQAVQFYYDFSLPHSADYQSAEFYLTIAFFAISFCLYLAIIVGLKKGRGIARQKSNGNNALNATVPFIDAQERSVLLQAGVLYAGMLALILDWFLGSLVDPFLSQLITFLVISYFGLNPALYLTMNAEFRDRFLRTYRFRRDYPKTVIVVNTITKVKPYSQNQTDK